MATKLTALKVENAKPGAARREIPDGGQPGLYLIVHPSGRKSWAVRYRHHDKPRKWTADGFVSLATARKMARDVLDAVAEGKDPAADKRAAKQAITPEELGDVADAFRLFLEKHARKKNGQPIRESSRRLTAMWLGFRRDEACTGWVPTGAGAVAKWKGKRVTDITHHDIRRLVGDIAEKTPVLANRTLAAIKLAFGWLAKRVPEHLPVSPAALVEDPAPEMPRARVLSDTEIAAIWKCAEGKGAYGVIVQTLILTGLRRSEVAEATWGEIDLDARTWTLAGLRTKNGHDHVLPISDQLSDLLGGLRRAGNGPVFTVNGRTPLNGLSKWKHGFEKVVTEALGHKPERWTLHDVRRTVATGLQRLGVRQEVTEAVLNHKSGVVSGVAAIYGRHSYESEKRAALDAWARHVEAIVTGEPGKVVPLRARA